MITFQSKGKWGCINGFVVITDLLLQRITDKLGVCMISVSHLQQLFITNCAIESPMSVNNVRHFPVHRKTEILLQYNCFFIFIITQHKTFGLLRVDKIKSTCNKTSEEKKIQIVALQRFI